MMAKLSIARYLERPYARVIMPDGSGGYASQILEFPGCFSDGSTPEEAYANLQEAAENWVGSALHQGMSIPEPFAAQGYSGTISLRLPKSMHRLAALYAQRDGVSLNQFLLSSIAMRIGAEEGLTLSVNRLEQRLSQIQSQGVYAMQGVFAVRPVASTDSPQVHLTSPTALAPGQEAETLSDRTMLADDFLPWLHPSKHRLSPRTGEG